VRLRAFSKHPHSHPLGHTSTTYFQVLGSPRKPVKLLKVLDMGELARSHSTTELLPLSSCTFYNTYLPTTNHCGSAATGEATPAKLGRNAELKLLPSRVAGNLRRSKPIPRVMPYIIHALNE
jgi:hypothetical protein